MNLPTTPLPAAFITALTAQLGEADAAAFFEALETPYAAALRLNPLRDNAEAAALPFTEAAVPWCKEGRYIKAGTRPGLSPVQAAGGFYIQEASAMAPASLLDAQPGEVILDLCAAPGGKSGQIAAALKNQGALIANEPDPSRVKILAATLERLGAANTLVTNAYPDELARLFPETFDAILTDAPCSGEGMFRREPDSRLEWKDASPEGCAARQAGILDEAAKMLKKGGRLVYSTCTFNRHENADTIAAFLERHPDFVIEDFTLNGVGTSVDGGIQLWPHKVRGDGQFAARLRKLGAADGQAAESRKKDKAKAKTPKKPAEDKEIASALKALKEIAPDWDARLGDYRIERRGDMLYAIPACLPDWGRLRVLRTGLHLCRMGRGYIEPDHALAMALKPDEAAQSRDFDEAGALTVLSGEVVEGDAKGWVLLTHLNMPLGWGKASGGVIKNHVPKGLRIKGIRE